MAKSRRQQEQQGGGEQEYEVRSAEFQHGEGDQVTTYRRGDRVSLAEAQAAELLAGGAIVPTAAAEEEAEAQRELEEAEAAYQEALARRGAARNAGTAASAAPVLGGEFGHVRGDRGSGKYEGEALGLAAEGHNPEVDEGSAAEEPPAGEPSNQ